ncbi:MAG: TIGR03986 family CRISPR-associated RAMP protein [Succinivibrionaceae bacterium]|nr:TIGR03986 family CRISPR-associated RAMP protein [Succinivibrionaceae bacterium]
MNKYIKAPFNFVPLSDSVFFPKWADQVSQDLPFSDAVSGTIHLKITAKSPMFIRNGHRRSDQEARNREWLSFSNENGRFFIPATSLKGEVRSILEIMSFSKMRVDKSAQFAQRDWDNPQLYPIKNPKEQPNIRCGWLKQIEDKETGDCVYRITDCGKPSRINHRRIDECLGGTLFEDNFSKKGLRLDKDKPDGYDPKTAAFKYHLLEKNGIPPESLENLEFSHDNLYKESYQKNRVCTAKKGKGEFRGTIVLTGQPDNWSAPFMKDGRLARAKSGGKFYEFVFPEPGDSAQEYTVSEDEFAHFEFIYRNSSRDRDAESGKSEWGFYRKKLSSNKGLPVFFRTEGGKIKDFGMAYLYKLPYGKSPYEALSRDHRADSRHDLAECIFGYASDEESLRGRVHFCSAFSDNAVEDSEVRLALGSPKASYYPLYIRQEGQGGKVKDYATYNDGRLAGWKRYHVRKEPLTGDGTCTNNDKIDTIIKPVKAGAEFTTDITFHNLRPVELGALLSALTFHNTEGCYHQLGQGKPYGYGKAVYEVSLDAGNDNSAKYYMALFEKAMNEFVMSIPSTAKGAPKKDWLQSEQMTALITMANQEVVNSADYMYMRMDNEKKINDFLDAKSKENREYLPPVTSRLRAVNAESLAGELPAGA